MERWCVFLPQWVTSTLEKHAVNVLKSSQSIHELAAPTHRNLCANVNHLIENSSLNSAVMSMPTCFCDFKRKHHIKYIIKSNYLIKFYWFGEQTKNFITTHFKLERKTRWKPIFHFIQKKNMMNTFETGIYVSV